MMSLNLRSRWWPAFAAASLCVCMAHADSTSPRMAVFSRSYTTNHYTSTWSGSAWGGATQYNTGPDEAIWIKVANCPTRDELAIVTQDYSYDVRLQFRIANGTFTSSTVATGDSGSIYTHRRCDVAYEQSSGDTLIAYYNKATTQIGYRTASSTAVSAQTLISLPTADHLRFLSLTAKPNSNEVVMLWMNAVSRICAKVWDGSSWGATQTLTTSGSHSDKECFAAAYEQTSGDLLVVYGVSGSSQGRYRTYSAGAWSAEQTMPATSDAAQWIRLASRPNANDIVCGILDLSDAAFANVWNGSSWGTVQSLGATGGVCEHRRIDVAYEPDGSHALAAYSTGASTIRYRTWNGSAWSSQQNGPNFGNAVSIILLQPGSSGSEILGLCSDEGWQLNAFRWSGSAMSGVQINDPLGGETNCEAFALVPPAGENASPRIFSWKQVKP